MMHCAGHPPQTYFLVFYEENRKSRDSCDKSTFTRRKRERKCIILAVGAAVIVAASSDDLEPGGSIKADGAISLAHFEVEAGRAVSSRGADEMVDQCTADPAPLRPRGDGDQQQFGFVGHRAEERETVRGMISGIARNEHRDPGHRQDPGAL